MRWTALLLLLLGGCHVSATAYVERELPDGRARIEVAFSERGLR